jgi:hypothetical protein
VSGTSSATGSTGTTTTGAAGTAPSTTAGQATAVDSKGKPIEGDAKGAGAGAGSGGSSPVTPRRNGVPITIPDSVDHDLRRHMYEQQLAAKLKSTSPLRGHETPEERRARLAEEKKWEEEQQRAHNALFTLQLQVACEYVMPRLLLMRCFASWLRCDVLGCPRLSICVSCACVRSHVVKVGGDSPSSRMLVVGFVQDPSADESSPDRESAVARTEAQT